MTETARNETRKRRGMSIMTEILMVIGILIIGFVFLGLSGQILGEQTSQVFTASQRNVADDITARINTMEGFKGATTVNYQPGVKQYTLHVTENSVIEVQLPNKDTSTSRFEDMYIENTVIEDEETICIRREGNTVELIGGNCTTVDLSNFCANDRCVNGVCEPDMGETCSDTDCNCGPSAYPDDADTGDVSEYCEPGYTADDYIDAPGAGDSEADTVPPMGCVDTDFTHVQEEGDQCDFDFECSEDMACTEAHPSSGVDGSYCCPDGQRWNGQECASPDVYDVVFVPLNYDSGEFNQFKQKAQDTFDVFLAESPFRTCSNPDNNVRAHYLSDLGGSCGSSGSTAICDECPREARSRVLSSSLSNTWDKIVGICKGDSCSPGTRICGCAMGIPSDASATNQMRCGGVSPAPVGVHELGHTQGLYHVEQCGAVGGCTGPNAPDCSEPVSDQQDFLMAYCNQLKYGPAAYSHLKNNVLADNLQGCNP